MKAIGFQEMLEHLRLQARKAPVPQWAMEQFDTATKGIPNKGRGTDVMIMDGVRRLPRKGRHAFVDTRNSCDEKIARPWQTLQALVMLRPRTRIR
eukprot:7256632-Pyramimonas_sp.AAC.1